MPRPRSPYAAAIHRSWLESRASDRSGERLWNPYNPSCESRSLEQFGTPNPVAEVERVGDVECVSDSVIGGQEMYAAI